MKLFRKFGSLKLTFVLLLILAVFSGIGTLIAQKEDAYFYLHSYGKWPGRIIIFLGVDDLYNSFLYSSLLFLLGINLFVCILNSFRLLFFGFAKNKALFLLHCGILLIFTGATLSKFTRYSQVKKLLPEEKMILPATKAGLKLKGFFIDYYPQTDCPRNYYSKVDLFEAGRFLGEKIIRVNHPLKFKGFNFYQSSFEVLAEAVIEVKQAGNFLWRGKIKQGEQAGIPGSDLKLEISYFIPDVLITREGKITLRSYILKNPALLISIYKSGSLLQRQWIFSEKNLDAAYQQDTEIFQVEIKQVSAVYAAVLQIVKEPGFLFVKTGFFSLVLGLALYLFYRRQRNPGSAWVKEVRC